MVHSARWTEVMLAGIDPHRALRTPDRRRFIQMLRCYGYGEPEVSRARFSASHAATLIREDQLRPYSGGTGKRGVARLPCSPSSMAEGFAHAAFRRNLHAAGHSQLLHRAESVREQCLGRLALPLRRLPASISRAPQGGVVFALSTPSGEDG
jgi:hypothetical protein